jgi:hypothetical protein
MQSTKNIAASVVFLLISLSLAFGQNVTPANPPVSHAAAKAAQKKGQDTLIVLARITEIPGAFPPNDLYNYVYIMKYRVIKVLKGTYKGQELLVGHYNPLIPRRQIKDRMRPLVGGDVVKFEKGARQRLVLVTPIENVWKDAVEDNYPDSDLNKYYALKADIAQ